MMARLRPSAGLVLLLLGQLALAGNWQGWRGDGQMGNTSENLPSEWAADKNIVWKVELPERGNSTPIVWQGQIFLTQALDGGKRRALVAYQLADGKKLWQHDVACATDETTHQRDNPPCSASAVTDGKAVFADFASAGVIACDLKGKLLWQRDLGPVLHKWGNGSSPVIYKDLLIVHHGPGEPAFLTALDKHTGKDVWKTPLVAINSPIFGSWSTPIILRVGDHDELIMPLPGERIGGPGCFKGFDPATGKELWTCSGLGNEIYAMPVATPDLDIVICQSGHNGPTMAVRPGGKGDVTETHRVWRHADKLPQRVGSGVVHDGHLYLADADGFAECLDVRTGKVIWKERLGGKLWGSMLRAGERLYVSNLEGETFVLAASPQFKQLARNALGEPLYAAPAAADGKLLLRTHKHLYCIGKQ